jgi:LysR family glycine cleavage system transcriptional activator
VSHSCRKRIPSSLWFKGVELDYRDTGQGPRYGEQNVLLAAAIAGLGVALARALFVQADLEAGRLIKLFPHSVRTKYSYFIVYPPGSEALGKIQAFQHWLLEQASGRQPPTPVRAALIHP